ncbi:cytochrome c family protein [Microbaculum marinum]|uniref:Cytochrome c family protein n=1 Tax=Microbaculum marinum TaxID=1764581 RepID=A0AAW9RQH0_9HYPH
MKILCVMLFAGLFAVFAIWGLPSRAAGDAGNGQDLFRLCNACHEIGPDARNRVGPILNNIVGRRAATRSGYSYSAGMREAGSEGFVWTVENLDGYIENPRAFLRGTKMAFSGMADAEQRQDLIAYLKTLKFDDAPNSRTFR